MSTLGHKRTFAPQKVMSALPPKADMCGATSDVCYGPKADMMPGYSTTSSTIESKPAGMARPNAFALLRLITNSNLVG
jgi:hypothetical protein